MNDLQIKYVPIESLKEFPMNPRKNDAAAEGLAKLMGEYGFVIPIVATPDGTIRAGHTRIKAARKQGMKEVPVIYVDFGDEKKAMAFSLADNKSHEWSEWDFPKLKDIITEIDDGSFDVALTGFKEDELKEIFGNNGGPPTDAEPKIDRAEELNKKWQVKAGDLWQIGEHRLLCGDSTKTEDVAWVMGGEKPLLMVTDPPYGVEYDASWRVDAGVQKRSFNSGKVENDNVSDWFSAFELFTGDVMYVWHAGVFASTVQASIEKCGFVIRAQIVWNKDLAVFGRGDYHWKHEPCWYAVRKGAKGNRTDDHKQSTVWDIPTIHSFANGKNAEEWKLTGHGTQKPLECMARPIRNYDSEFVYDPFLGSGTTMVACQNLNRKCRGIEISPNYCAVILERMAMAFPGIEIKRIENGPESNN